jgi:DNA-binding transcriptional LysR family regulator
MLRSGELTMCFVRLPVATEGLHLIPLYDEQPVVVASQAHPVAAFDGIDVADLADEQRLDDTPSSLPDVMDRVAADEGVLVLPLSLARLHHRRDVVHVPVTGVPATTVGLAWRRDAEDDRIETFVGVVRGRTENSSREARPSPGRRRR